MRHTAHFLVTGRTRDGRSLVLVPVRCLVALGLSALLVGAAAPEPGVAAPFPAGPEERVQPPGTAWFGPASLAEMLRLLPPRLTPAHSQFLLGRDLVAKGRHAEAIPVLRRAIPGLGPILLYGQMTLAQALMYGGSAAEAAGLFEAVAVSDPTGPLAEPARFLAADAHLRAGRAAEALSRYRALARTVQSEARRELVEYAIATALLASGDVKGACRAFQAFWLERPGHFASRSAGKAARRLRKAGACPGPTAAERLARAERLLAAGRTTQARKAVDKAHPLLTPAQHAEARWLRARIALAQGDPAWAAREAGALLVAPAADPRLKHQARALLAKLASKAGDHAAAGDHYLILSREAAGTALGQEAAFLWAWTAFNQGNHAEAVRRFGAVLASKSAGSRAEEALWFLGWNQYRAGRLAEAARTFAEVATASPPQRSRALYWRGRALMLLRRPEAAEVLRSVLSTGGADWYAVLARERLAEMSALAPGAELAGARLAEVAPPALAPPSVAPFPPPPEPEAAPLPQSPRVERASLLLDLGLPALAQGELMALERELRARKAALDGLLSLFERAGMYHRALLLAETVFAPKVFGPNADRRYAARAFPAAYPATVAEAAATTGLDPYLLLALMKRESAFRPAVRSPARAEGLLQLMPATARKILALHGLPGPRSGHLAEPELNVPLGAWYFAELFGRYGNLAVAAAAYNAGPRAVDAWLARMGPLPVDEFVEEIPFKETRAYVRAVMSNYAAYRALYGGSERAGISLAALSPPKDGVRF